MRYDVPKCHQLRYPSVQSVPIDLKQKHQEEDQQNEELYCDYSEACISNLFDEISNKDKQDTLKYFGTEK